MSHRIRKPGTFFLVFLTIILRVDTLKKLISLFLGLDLTCIRPTVGNGPFGTVSFANNFSKMMHFRII